MRCRCFCTTFFRFYPHAARPQFIAGLSMGGYGALYLGMSRPDIWGGCASFPAPVDLSLMLRDPNVPACTSVCTHFRRQPGAAKASNLHYVAQKGRQNFRRSASRKFLLTNGLQDFEPYHIVEQNDSLHATLHKLNLAYYRRIQWDGVHEWNFWDRSLVYAIDYFWATVTRPRNE